VRSARVLVAVTAFLLLLGGIAATPASAIDGPTVDLRISASVPAGPYLVEESLPVDLTVTNTGNVPSGNFRATLTNIAGSGFDIPDDSWGALNPYGPGTSLMPGETRAFQVHGKVSTGWSGPPQVRFEVSGPEDANPADNQTEITIPMVSPDTRETVDGLVFADKDENGSASPEEGLAGIKVVLTRGSVSYEKITDAEGKFSFADIPVGVEYYLATRDMPSDWYIPDGGKMLRLDGSGANTGLTFRALRPLSASLHATMKLDKKSYPVGATARLTVKLTNSSTQPIIGIEAACDRGGFERDLEITQAAWGELASQGAGATVEPGQTRTFVVSGTVPAIAGNFGYLIQGCDFNLDASFPEHGPEASAAAKVPGMRGSTTGLLFHDDNGNGRADPGEGLADQELVLTDRDAGCVITGRTDATGRATVTGPAGRYHLRIAGPWKILERDAELYLVAAPVNLGAWTIPAAHG
jgi:hypothetical protein